MSFKNNNRNYSQPDIKDYQIGPSIHHHFEQFSLDESYKNRNDCNSLEADTYFTQKLNNIQPVTTDVNLSNAPIENESKLLDLESDGYKMKMNKGYSYERDASLLGTSQRMPVGTPYGIPEIIFTDFSNSNENNTGTVTYLLIRYLRIQ